MITVRSCSSCRDGLCVLRLPTLGGQRQDCAASVRAVLMARVDLHYEAGHYTEAAQLLDGAADACSEHPAWRLNMAHTLFMNERYECVCGPSKSLPCLLFCGINGAAVCGPRLY